ncbi:MAG: hypothetical protein ACJ714_14595, partial [Ornithinibacter sp.]
MLSTVDRLEDGSAQVLRRVAVSFFQAPPAAVRTAAVRGWVDGADQTDAGQDHTHVARSRGGGRRGRAAVAVGRD